MAILKKIFRFLINSLIIFFITLILFELAYRNSIIDFYASEYKSYNFEGAKGVTADLLIFGDSFSAGNHTYVNRLRDSDSSKKIISSAVQGIGLKQINSFIERRVNQHKPKAILYQVYVGNDLTDINHLSNYENLSLLRNLYWGTSDLFISLSYINYKLGGLKSKMKNNHSKNIIDLSFSKENYNRRTLLKLKADKGFINKSVRIEEDFILRYKTWSREFKKFIDKLPDEIPVYILFLPHCAQVNEYYFQNMRTINASFSDQNTFQEIDYPFYTLAREEFEKQSRIKFLNVLDFFRKSDSINRRIYYENDPHLNDLGHQVLCNFIQENIKF